MYLFSNCSSCSVWWMNVQLRDGLQKKCLSHVHKNKVHVTNNGQRDGWKHLTKTQRVVHHLSISHSPSFLLHDVFLCSVRRTDTR